MPAAPQRNLHPSARAYAAEDRETPVQAVPGPSLSERRQLSRRSARADRALVLAASIADESQWIPRQWPYLLLCMTAAIGCSMLVAHRLPGNISGPLLGSALVIALGVPLGHRVAQGRGWLVRLAAVLVVVILPLFLFGLGMTIWTVRQGLPWDIALAALLWVGSIAGAYLRRQPGVMFAGQLAMWAAAAIVHQSLAAGVTLGVAFVVAAMVARDQVREQREEEQRKQASERVHTRARDILADYERTQQGWFWETDRRGMLTYISPPIAEALGHSPEEMMGCPLVDLFDLEDTGQEGERTLLFHLSARSAFQELSIQSAINTEERWWSISGRPIFDDFDNFVGFRGSGTDLTEKRRSQEHASRLANYDSLTGLANRFQMSQALGKILTMPQEAHRACAVLLLDLDRFKHVNDTMGHPAGDALLVQVAGRLERAVGQSGQVGRLGGDEFQVIVPGRIERRQLATLASDIISSLSQPYSIEGQRVVIGASIGIALAPDDGMTSDELIRNVDLALYAAKDGGRGRLHFFAKDLHAEAESRAELEKDLRDAIATGGLMLYYQPIVATASEQITGFEALLRWQHPVKGWIPPDKFVKIAEESGLIAQIGEWALRAACHDLAKWPEDIRCAVNVSPLQFANPQLPTVITNAIAQAGIDPSRLELEITESVFLNEDEGRDAMFAALKRIGVRLALDDFGTGYSSLGYLKNAPFDKIKIDQSFVRGATQPESRNGAIIASITSLAHALGMDTTAEGVETLDELDLVRMHGCSHIQGFIYERPLDPEAATERLRTGLTAIARGHRLSRSPRHTMLRKVVLDHQGNLYNGTIRNISSNGAMIEGLWNVPLGTLFKIQISTLHRVTATTRWCEEDRMGVEFSIPLERDSSGRIVALQAQAPEPTFNTMLKEAG
jgi:diguanylate cyclase (GGDEF)-like protein/PAS domain S-box-containing protein